MERQDSLWEYHHWNLYRAIITEICGTSFLFGKAPDNENDENDDESDKLCLSTDGISDNYPQVLLTQAFSPHGSLSLKISRKGKLTSPITAPLRSGPLCRG